jgi:hypothetical protein
LENSVNGHVNPFLARAVTEPHGIHDPAFTLTVTPFSATDIIVHATPETASVGTNTEGTYCNFFPRLSTINVSHTDNGCDTDEPTDMSISTILNVTHSFTSHALVPFTTISATSGSTTDARQTENISAGSAVDGVMNYDTSR